MTNIKNNTSVLTPETTAHLIELGIDVATFYGRAKHFSFEPHYDYIKAEVGDAHLFLLEIKGQPVVIMKFNDEITLKVYDNNKTFSDREYPLNNLEIDKFNERFLNW
jgi:hypothetical protein